mgnify:CR=1 FL=1
MKRTYYERCYIAFYWTLEHIFRQSDAPTSPHPFSLCDLLSDMCPFTFSTGMSADPAAYADYEDLLKSKIRSEDDETVLNGYAAGREYMQMYMAEYEYELEYAVENYSLDDYALAYEKANAENTQ